MITNKSEVVILETKQYRIGELSELTGVTRRTIHYYLGRGLLPPPEGAGLGTTYSDEHRYRIQLIKKLQDTFLPLDEIKKRITGMSQSQVEDALKNEFLQASLNEPIAEYMPKRNIGKSYERINVGFGLEIQYPSENVKAIELAEKLYRYAETLIKEE